jgi:hypothetical protein
MKHYLELVELEKSTHQASQLSNSVSDSTPAIWVQLAVCPSAYSHSQALLLCRYSDDEWLAWIPDHGETVLHVSEFFFASELN